MNQVQVIKRVDIPQVQPEPITPFQLGHIRVKTQNALKLLELYASEVDDPAYKRFLTERLTDVVYLAIDKI